MIASNVIIRTADGHPIYDLKTKERANLSRSIKIEEHVWLCDGVMVLKGVNIGEGAIVATRSVITRDVPSHTICAGIPAEVVKKEVFWERNIHTKTPKYYEP